MYRRVAALAVVVLISISISAVRIAAADEPPPAPAPSAPAPPAAAPEAPAVVPAAPAVSPAPAAKAEPTLITPDTDIFRRTPVIDGVIDDGEWDAFYTYSCGDWQITTYADWDARDIYVGAKSNEPIDLLNVLDANNDGWFHGDENYEFKATRAGDGSLTLTVCRYESRNTKSPVATPVTDAEAAMVELKSTKSDTSYMIEMRVPASLIRGLKLAAGKKIGFQIDVKTTPDDSGWVPTNQLGDVRECTLVSRKFASLKPLVLGFDLKDPRVARGEELVGRFHMTNTGTETLDARNFVVAGEGKAGDYLSSEKIRIEGLRPKQHIARQVRTIVPKDMPTGSWAIGAEVRSNDARLGAALVSFEVVDPFEVELRVPSTNVRADVKDVTLGVVVRNNTRGDVRGKAKITLPIGWELWKNADTREFTVGSGGSVSSVAFKAKPPLGEMGSVPVKVVVTVGSESKTVEGKFSVVNP